MLEYSSDDGDQGASDPEAAALDGRPDEWLAPATAPLASAPVPESLTLTFTVTIDDMMTSVLANEPALRRYQAAVWRTGWLRSWWVLLLTLGLSLLANLFMFELDVAWSVWSTVGLAVLFCLVRWSQIDHVVKRSLPALLERQCLRQLAERGDERRITADVAGVTLGDAASSTRFAWPQVRLGETERHVLLAAGDTSWAIPTHLGERLRSLVSFARRHGAT